MGTRNGAGWRALGASLLLAGMVASYYSSAVGEAASPASAQVPRLAGAHAQLRREVPYRIDKRPMPSGSDLEVLVPRTVGQFTRPPLPAGSKPPTDEDLNVNYGAGPDSVFFGFSMPETVADAHEAVKTTRKEAIASKLNVSKEQYSVGTDPSFFKLPAFMSWSRGRYFYYAQASSPAALDRFMRAFPY